MLLGEKGGYGWSSQHDLDLGEPLLCKLRKFMLSAQRKMTLSQMITFQRIMICKPLYWCIELQQKMQIIIFKLVGRTTWKANFNLNLT